MRAKLIIGGAVLALSGCSVTVPEFQQGSVDAQQEPASANLDGDESYFLEEEVSDEGGSQLSPEQMRALEIVKGLKKAQHQSVAACAGISDLFEALKSLKDANSGNREAIRNSEEFAALRSALSDADTRAQLFTCRESLADSPESMALDEIKQACWPNAPKGRRGGHRGFMPAHGKKAKHPGSRIGRRGPKGKRGKPALRMAELGSESCQAALDSGAELLEGTQ